MYVFEIIFYFTKYNLVRFGKMGDSTKYPTPLSGSLLFNSKIMRIVGDRLETLNLIIAYPLWPFEMDVASM